MKRFGIPFVAALFFVGLALAAMHAGNVPVADEKDLQGTWSGERFLNTKGPEGGVKLSITFKGNKIIGVRSGGDEIGDGTFSVPASGQLDATGTSKGYKGKKYLGIFKIDGDTLTWTTTYGADPKARPSEYGGKGQVLLVLKKQK